MGKVPIYAVKAGGRQEAMVARCVSFSFGD